MSSDAAPPKAVVLKQQLDGTTNPKYVDVLDEDKAVAGQKYCCLSFISPEEIVKDRKEFMLEAFLKQWELNKAMEKFTQFISYVAYKHKVSFDALQSDLVEFCKEEKNNLFTTSLSGDFKTFLDNNEERLAAEFDEENQFKTSVRGVKVRGSYPSIQEAQLRAKMLREADPTHDVYVGQVGIWMPFHPEAYKTGRVEYMESELNQLMHEKNKNEASAKQEFEDRVKASKKKAIEDNKKKALESGNVLTQTIDKDGNLVSVKDINTFDGALGDDVSVADIRKELFEDENVVTQVGDHGLSNLTMNATQNEIKSDE
jgi:hypothetical protein